MTIYEQNRPVDPLLRLRLFGPVEALRVGGDCVLPRGRKAQAILCYLALSPDGAVPRQRLVDLLWSTRGDEQGRASLRQSLLELRAALGDRPEAFLVIERDRIALDRRQVWIDALSRREDAAAEPDAPPHIERLLETLEGLDPRFDEWIVAVRAAVAAAHGAPDEHANSRRDTTARKRLPHEDRAVPSEPAAEGLLLSVAPLIKVGPGVLDDYVAPALTQEIVTALARVRWIQVRFSPSQRDCDAQYRLEGYLSRMEDQCRVVMRLIDQADRGVVAWTGSIQAAYPLQYQTLGDLVEQVVEQLDPEILNIETRKALRRPHVSADSYECVLRAIQLIYRFDEVSCLRAGELLERAMNLDPQHGRAYAFSALRRLTALAQGWSRDPDHDLRQLDREATQAVACDARDSLALALSAHIRAFLHHDFPGALTLFERALHANPSCGLAWGYSALTHAYTGQTDEAARRLMRAQTIMIHDPYSSFLEAFAGVIAYFAGDWVSTIAVCRRQLELRPTFTNKRKLLIGALCFAGRHDEARGEDRILAQQEPKFTWAQHLQTYPFGRAEDRRALEAVLRRVQLLSDTPSAPRLVAANRQ
jgi:adenylate cyclase